MYKIVNKNIMVTMVTSCLAELPSSCAEFSCCCSADASCWTSSNWLFSDFISLSDCCTCNTTRNLSQTVELYFRHSNCIFQLFPSNYSTWQPHPPGGSCVDTCHPELPSQLAVAQWSDRDWIVQGIREIFAGSNLFLSQRAAYAVLVPTQH